MAQNHQSSSQYFTTPIKNNRYLDVLNLRFISKDPSDLKITIDAKYANRPDLLAYELYQNPNLWWVLVVRNMDTLVDPLDDFREGVEIYAPTAQRVFGEIM